MAGHGLDASLASKLCKSVLSLLLALVGSECLGSLQVVFVSLLAITLEDLFCQTVTFLLEGGEVGVGGALGIGSLVHGGDRSNGLHVVGGGGDV